MNDPVESSVGYWAASAAYRAVQRLAAPHDRVAALLPTHHITPLKITASYRLEYPPMMSTEC